MCVRVYICIKVYMCVCVCVCVYGRTHGIWKFPGQGLNPNCSHDLHHSCGSTRSFNPLCLSEGQTAISAATQAAAVRFLTHCSTVGTPP